MKRRTWFFAGLAVIALGAWSCGMMAKMMGMGDLMGAMKNMDHTMMAMTPEELKQHAMAKQAAAWERGKALFTDAKTGGGTNGLACNSCHPNGATTGGEAQIPMRDYKMPIPTLIGAAGTFPKYKIPNDAVITLQQMNNNCIRMFMAGKGFELNSPEAWALETYVASLSNGETVTVGGQMMKSKN